MTNFIYTSSTKGAEMFKDTTIPINPDRRAAAVVGTGLAAAALSLFAVAGPAHAQQGGADKAIDEIVVTTARRREESLMEVPLSISVLGGVDLERVGAVDIVEIAKQSPNVTLEVSRGTNTTLTAFIRGVGQQDRRCHQVRDAPDRSRPDAACKGLGRHLRPARRPGHGLDAADRQLPGRRHGRRVHA